MLEWLLIAKGEPTAEEFATGSGAETRRGGSSSKSQRVGGNHQKTPWGGDLTSSEIKSLLQPSSSLMERVDGARWSWRSASVCAVSLGNICFFIASLTVLVLSLTKQQPPPHQPSTSSQVSAAHLVLDLNGTTSITRGTLDWFYKDVEGAFLGPSFEYSSQKLKIKKDGLYCIYAQINVTCRGDYIKKIMNASLYIHHKKESNHHNIGSNRLLTLTLHLSNPNPLKEYTNSISQIYQLSRNDILYGTLNGTTEADSNWALQSTGNFFGVFRINEKDAVQKRL